ncbi:hypothetical protein J5X84_13795 [Streptosporangiaceae bacterium NEAU-GS5]|nr:hypothetical protein [Streptosporangiaceae bacterium NEAU-GS5]
MGPSTGPIGLEGLASRSTTTPPGPGTLVPTGRHGGPRPGGPLALDAGSGPERSLTPRRAILAACTAIVVAAIGTAAYFAYTSDSRTGNATGTPALTSGPSGAGAAGTAAPTGTAVANAGTVAALDSEATDPEKLTLAEAFPDPRITLDGRTYKRVKVNITESCDKAASGGFAAALKQQQCRRVLRATYVDGKHKYAVTTGIAVLPTKQAALAVDAAKNLGSNLWFRGLNGDAASGADRVAISGGYAAGLVWGRYIVFTYATYADGHTPTSKEKDLGPVSGAFRDHTAKVIEERLTHS